MKTDKLLQLIQQKKFMRSGGALPLPKAVTGNEGQCDPKTEYWDPKLKRCIPRNNPFLQYNIQDAYDYAKKYDLQLDDESKKYIDEHYTTADPRWLPDTYNTGRLDEKGKEVWEDIPFIKKMDDIASKNLGVSDWNKELCPCSNHAEGSHYDNTKYTPEYKQRISTMMNKDPEATKYFLAKCGCFRGDDRNFSKETTVDNPEYMDKLKSRLKNEFDSSYANSWHVDTVNQRSEAYDFLRNLYPDKDSNDLHKEVGDMTAVYTKDMVDDEGNVRDEYARQYYDREYKENKGVKELADIVTSGYYNAQPATRYFQVKQEGNSDKPWENKYFVSQQGEGMVDNQGLKKWNPITSEFSTPNELGTWHTIGYDEYQRLKEQEDPKGMVTYQEFKRQGGSLPIAQAGKPIYVTNPNDPRLKAYNDSLQLYNSYQKAHNKLKSLGFGEPIKTNQVTQDYNAPFHDSLNKTLKDLYKEYGLLLTKDMYESWYRQPYNVQGSNVYDELVNKNLKIPKEKNFVVFQASHKNIKPIGSEIVTPPPVINEGVQGTTREKRTWTTDANGNVIDDTGYLEDSKNLDIKSKIINNDPLIIKRFQAPGQEVRIEGREYIDPISPRIFSMDEELKPMTPIPQEAVRKVMNPAFDFNVDFMPNRTKEAVVDQAGNPRYKYYNQDKVISEQEYNQLMQKRQGGPLPKAQIGLFPSLFNQNTPTQNTKKEPAAPPKNLTPYEQLVNSYNTYNDTYKQSFNKLNTWPKFSGETIELTNGRYKGTKVPVEYFNMLNDSARRFKLDPYTLFAIAGRESTLGQDPRYKNRNANPMTLVSGWDVAEPYQPYTLDRYLADQRVPGVTSSKDFHGYYYKINDQNQVNAYLAKHPEIVNGYIKKLQATPKLTYTNPFDLISKFIIDKGISRYNPGQKEYSKLINNEIVSLKKEKNLSNFLLKHKEEGGSLTEYQKKGQTGLPKGYMSYQSNPEWFDNRAVYHDNERFNDTIRKLVYSGKAAYNPEKGALHFINGKPADAATQQMATEDYTRGVRRDPTNPEYAGADQRTKQIIQNTTEQAYQNPLMYAPGMIGMSMLPTTWGMGYGLGSSLGQFGQGNYRDAAIGAGLSLLPFAQPTILKNQVIPRVLSSDIVGNYVSPKITNRIFERNISPANWSNYATESIGKGGFGEAHTFKNFPNHVWKVSNSGKTAGLFDVDFNKLRFEKIIPKPYGTEHPNYIKTFIGNPTISTDNNYELMTRVPGSPLRDLNWQQMNEIPQESWQQLHRTLDRLRQNDVGVDLVGKNILYDQPSKQFGVIDLTPGMSEMMPDDIDWVFGGMHKSLNADQAKTRILENIASQVKRAGHINKGRGLQNLTGLNSDEFLILLDEYRNANYNNKQYKDFVLDKINNLKRRGGQLRKAALGNEGEDPLEQAKKWLMAHPQQAAPQTKQTLDLSRNAVNANNKFTSKDAQKSDKAYIQSTNAQAMLQAQQAESERINKLAKENNMSPMDVVLAEKRYKADRQKRAAELEAGAPFREVSLFGKPSDTQLGFPTPDAYATGLKNPFNWPTYALGAYYGGAALGAAGELAYPYVGPAFTSIFETPAVIGGRTVPWLTGNNILGLEMATNTPGNIERGEYGQALLNTMPFWLNSTTMNLAGKTYGATRNLFAEAANKGRNLFNDARIATAEGANKFGKALKENVVVDALNFKNLRKKYDAA
jgi:hypothetical protein